MRDYLLFLDTEASGLPKKWDQPYTNSTNWPTAVQLSWLIYNKDGTLVKSENHYIYDPDVKIQPSAIKIHGLTSEYLQYHGGSRTAAMQLLADDLLQYQPMVVGHYMEFDYHITAADFCRSNIQNPIEQLPVYCTMQASTAYVRDPKVTYLRLGEFYAALFNQTLENQHNALADACATSECFFELLKRGNITDDKIEALQSKIKSKKHPKKFPWLRSAIAILIIVIIISFCL